ncbi:MAG TPA: septal ring lytic transglycosylase RlpA family protein [Candidatus Andersenbacteria bacterium]|nr:septal ring lytic transglycosylase RlpA family protein [Candidatus Andersenbacteria bacterium]
MTTSNILRHKHLINTIIAIIATILPTQALAFELPPEITPAALFGSAPETTHSYSSGTLVANASPVTTVTKLTKRTIAPRTYSGSSVVMEGIASYYSKAGCLGCNPLFVMANGQVLDDNALTMAIGADKKHLVGYQAKVTNLANGQSVVVRITDTGGFYKDKYGNRVADLTIGTKQAIGMNGGLGKVRVEVL